MSSIIDSLPPQSTLDGVWSGIIATNPTGVDDPVFVIIPAYTDEHRWGPCNWVTRGNVLPERGQECLVVFNENQKPYVIAWWDGTLGGGSIHAASHKSGGIDPIKLDELAAPTDVSSLNASASTHGLLKKLSNNASEFMDGAGNWDTVKYADMVLAGLIKNGDLVASNGVLADMPPGRKLTYNQITAPVTVSGTVEALATIVVTATAFTFDGTTPVKIEAWFPYVYCGTGATLIILLWDNTAGAAIGQLAGVVASGLTLGGIKLEREITPASGSRTYSIRAYRGVANCEIGAGVGGAGAYMPGFIKITKV